MYDINNNHLPDFITSSFNQLLNPVHDVRLRNHRKYLLPHNSSQRFLKSTIPSSIKQWELVPPSIRERYSRNSFKYEVKIFLGGRKDKFVTTKLDMPRPMEIILNKTRCDLLLKAHLYSHNFTNVRDPSCVCGNTIQSTKHLFFNCPFIQELREDFINDLLVLPAFQTFYRSCNTIDDRLQALLYGHMNLTYDINKTIIERTSLFLLDAVRQLGTICQ